MRTPLERATHRQLFKALRTIRRLKSEMAIDLETVSHVQTVDAQTINSLENENERLKGLLEFYSTGVQSKNLAIAQSILIITRLETDTDPEWLGKYPGHMFNALVEILEILKNADPLPLDGKPTGK